MAKSARYRLSPPEAVELRKAHMTQRVSAHDAELTAYGLTIPPLTPAGNYEPAALAAFLALADRAKVSDIDLARMLDIEVYRALYARSKQGRARLERRAKKVGGRDAG